ncbi:unnamed protein product [Rotaria sordida]|uniref:Coiled-coil domain-containing protein 86 n=1 Tax=Rotaria sordida TaxID=392033 RepID=A0A814SPT1_9BILA|nr:unnamed protein product [Rotaria sordida]CAF3546194.1 unnamed protein product [Rotaria sordida]
MNNPMNQVNLIALNIQRANIDECKGLIHLHIIKTIELFPELSTNLHEIIFNLESIAVQPHEVYDVESIPDISMFDLESVSVESHEVYNFGSMPDIHALILDFMDAETSTKQEKQRLNSIPKGKPKSGRTWKMNKGRFSAISRPKSIKLSYEDRIKMKTDLNETRTREKQMWDVVNEKRDKLKQRQKENKERRLINERKGEVVQVIKNPTKIKRMKKKQLRSIQKRDLDKLKNKKSN